MSTGALIEIAEDDSGKVRLSRRAAMKEREAAAPAAPAEQPAEAAPQQ